ncbi:hypothetical protein GOP47_0009801 [Adiantum capillus-veneris]|uniref:F-box domain-containing protein n=1 Tax=Adiantum capillus-veneris TaxID=13818 RepID=A0A9D4UXP8_ADICA|nr:hypothetical protein GOP47_0009801 [Adiantum capillus-veneris]
MEMEADEREDVGAETPSVMARLSAVSLTEVPPALHLQHDAQKNHGESAFSVSSMDPAMDEKENVDAPCWAEMLPDALAKIFNHLSLKEMLCTIPCVCRYWQCVSQDAACWQNIDLLEWSSDKQPKIVDRMLLLLVNRSQGGLRRVCVPNLKNDSMLQLIASSGSQLEVLRIQDSFASEECLCEVAPKLSNLTYLDISGRFPSGALIESFGKHCKLITRLNLNMRLNVRESKSCDVAALAIAQHMQQLQHLEMAYGLLSIDGLKALLENCRDLQHLDLRGCWHLDMEESLVSEATKRIKVFLSPVVEDDIYDISDYDIDYEDDDELDSADYMFEDPEFYDDELMFDDLGAAEDVYYPGTEGFLDQEDEEK